MSKPRKATAPDAAVRGSSTSVVRTGIAALLTLGGLAYALYRWEMNIRMAAVLGFVGAGGLGQMLYYHLSLFHQAQAATVLLAMVLLVFAVDALSSAWRRRLAPAYG